MDTNGIQDIGTNIVDVHGHIYESDEGEKEVEAVETKSGVYKGFDYGFFKISVPGESIPVLYYGMASRQIPKGVKVSHNYELKAREDTELETEKALFHYIDLTWKSYYSSK